MSGEARTGADSWQKVAATMGQENKQLRSEIERLRSELTIAQRKLERLPSEAAGARQSPPATASTSAEQPLASVAKTPAPAPLRARAKQPPASVAIFR
jgi:hypothetical protein